MSIFRLGGPALVLKQFRVGPVSDDVILEVRARQPGLMSFLLTLFGLDTETALKVDRRSVTFSGSSLFGQTVIMAPLTAVTATVCGYAKSLGHLVMAVSCLLGYAAVYVSADGSEYQLEQTSAVRMVLFFVGLAFLAAYWLSRRLIVSIQAGDSLMGLVFKRSLIENVDVDFEKARLAIEAVNMAVLAAQQGKTAGTPRA